MSSRTFCDNNPQTGVEMKRLIFRTLLFVCFLISSSASFSQEFTIDFSTAKKYVDSLSTIRNAIGTSLPNISSGGTSLMVIDNDPGESLLTFNIRGLDPEEERFDHLRLIVDRNNLYVLGFINQNNNTFYRFSDFAHIDISNVSTVNLSGDSSYTTLQRIAGINRVGMQINRHSLITSYTDLVSFSGSSLTPQAARAILRFVTVTSEALRFRQIQRGFRSILDDFNVRSYTMTAEDVDLTLNWGRLSSILPDYQGQSAVRAGRISLGGVNAILGAVALILNCYQHPAYSFVRYVSDDFPSMCPADRKSRGITKSNILWDSSTLGAILVRKTITNWGVK